MPSRRPGSVSWPRWERSCAKREAHDPQDGAQVQVPIAVAFPQAARRTRARRGDAVPPGTTGRAERRCGHGCRGGATRGIEAVRRRRAIEGCLSRRSRHLARGIAARYPPDDPRSATEPGLRSDGDAIARAGSGGQRGDLLPAGSGAASPAAGTRTAPTGTPELERTFSPADGGVGPPTGTCSLIPCTASWRQRTGTICICSPSCSPANPQRSTWLPPPTPSRSVRSWFPGLTSGCWARAQRSDACWTNPTTRGRASTRWSFCLTTTGRRGWAAPRTSSGARCW